MKNQTFKVVRKYFIQKQNQLIGLDQLDTLSEWKDKEEKNLDAPMQPDKELEIIAEVLSNICSLILAFENFDMEEFENVAETSTEKKENVTDIDLTVFFINDLKLLELHPLTDIIVASSFLYTISSHIDLSNEEEVIGKFIESVRFFLETLVNKYEKDSENKFSAINVEALEQGQIVKNYKELCKILNQEVEEGNSKKAQLKEFQRYFEYQKIGIKFLITFVYDTPLPRVDGRQSGNTSVYVKYIETILMRYMSLQDDKNYICRFTKRNLWLLLGMINENYGKISMSELQKLKWSENMSLTYISSMRNNFYYRCNSILTQILFTALKNLRNRRLISYDEEIMIVEETDDYKERRFIANDFQRKIIDKIEQSVLCDMGFYNVTQVYCRYKADEFYRRVNQKMYDQMKWKYSYKQYKLIYTSQVIQQAIPEQEAELAKSINCEKIIEAVNRNAVTRYEKQEKKYLDKKHSLEEKRKVEEDTWGTSLTVINDKTIGVYTFPKFYIKAQALLAEELLRYGKSKKQTCEEEEKEQMQELDELFSLKVEQLETI